MNVKIGEKIKELRKRGGITQDKLATALGVTNQAISKWESENGYPDIEYIKPIANFFNVTIDYLFDNDTEEELIEVQFGHGLLPLVDERQGSNFTDRIRDLKQKFADNTGIIIDCVVLRDNQQLTPNGYLIKIKGKDTASGEIVPDRYLTMGLAGKFSDIDGIETKDPAFGNPAKWILPSNVEKAEKLGYVVIDPSSVIITHLYEVIKKHIV